MYINIIKKIVNVVVYNSCIAIIEKIYFSSSIKNIIRRIDIHLKFLKHNNFGNEIQKRFYV